MPKESPEEALQLCLKKVKEHCDIEFPDRVLTELADAARPKFEKYDDQWAVKRELVLLSASFLGKIAGHLAQDEKKDAQQVELRHAWAANEFVKKICSAHHDGLEVLYDWCP